MAIHSNSRRYPVTIVPMSVRSVVTSVSPSIFDFRALSPVVSAVSSDWSAVRSPSVRPLGFDTWSWRVVIVTIRRLISQSPSAWRCAGLLSLAAVRWAEQAVAPLPVVTSGAIGDVVG